MEATNEIAVCDCGHAPTPRGNVGGVGTMPDGRRLCLPCAEDAEVAAFAKADRYFAYLTRRDGRLVLTTWTGRKLADVTRANERKLGGTFGGSGHVTRTYLRAVAPDGSQWHGTSPGEGMYCRVRRAVRS